MTPEAIIEAAMRGLVAALLSTGETESKRAKRNASQRRRAPAAQFSSPTAPPSLFDDAPVRAEDIENGVVPPPSAEELDRLLQGIKEADIERALQGSDPPGTYRPDEGVTPWMGSREHIG